VSNADYELDTTGLDNLIRNAPQGVDDVVNRLAYIALGIIQTSWSEPPSAPGNPPAIDTGALNASMRVAKQGHAHYIIADGVEYGFDLEMGRTNIAPRPFMNPAIEQVRPMVPDEIRRAIARWL